MSNIDQGISFSAGNTSKEPAFYSGHFLIDKSSQVKDTLYHSTIGEKALCLLMTSI